MEPGRTSGISDGWGPVGGRALGSGGAGWEGGDEGSPWENVLSFLCLRAIISCIINVSETFS